MSQVTFSVPEMHCGACEASIRKALALPGVESVTVDLESKTVSVRHNPGQVDEPALRSAIERSGFDVTA